MLKKSKITILIAVSQLVVVFVLVAGSLFAWFSMTIKSSAGEITLRIVGEDNGGFQLVSVNTVSETRFSSRDIWPGDEVFYEVKTIKDGSDFSINFNIRKTDSESFNSRLGKAELLRGPYEKLMFFDEGAVERYIDFDIDKDPAYETIEDKLAFLKRFTENNKIVSAFTAEINKIVRADETEVELISPISLMLDETGLVLYPNPDDLTANGLEQLIFNEGDTVFLKMVYGRRMLDENTEWMPTMEIENGDGTKEYYRALNLNCFIGQSVALAFRTREII